MPLRHTFEATRWQLSFPDSQEYLSPQIYESSEICKENMAVQTSLGGCKNGAAPDTTLEKLSEIFLTGLHQYTYNDFKLKIQEPDEFDDVDRLFH